LLGLILWVLYDELLHFTVVGDSKETGKESESTVQYNAIL